MKRKVNKVGQNTLTVSLPSKWVEDNNIKKGDELDIYPKGDTITLSRTSKKRQKKEIIINIDNYNSFALTRHLTILYRMSYDSIILKYSKNSIFSPKKRKDVLLKRQIKKLIDRFMGAEIVAQSAKRTEIECFISEDQPSLEKIEKRIYFLIKETMTEMLESVGQDYKHFHESMYDHHDHISKFINYYLRTLYASGRPKEEKRLGYAVYQVIDKIVDKLRHVDEAINTHGCSPKVKKVLKDIFDYLCEQMLLVNKTEVNSEFIIERYKEVKKVREGHFTVKELRVLMEADLFLNTLNDFSEYVYLRKSLRS